MNLVFIDAEYTGEHAYTTLVSLGLVTLDGDSLYLPLDDYDTTQVTEWLRANVLGRIDPAGRVSSAEAYRRVADWLDRYASGARVHLVSAGLGPDLLLLFELWKHARPGGAPFHALHDLPPYLNHAQHFDLNTLLFLTGHDPDDDREKVIGRARGVDRHDALYDARIVRECFLELVSRPELRRLASAIEKRA